MGWLCGVDQKCKGSVQIEPTPVLITSNTYKCAVVDGNSTTLEHKGPLEERMFLFRFTVKLRHDFGKISKWEVREFFQWGHDNAIPVEPVLEVPTGANKPRLPETAMTRPVVVSVERGFPLPW